MTGVVLDASAGVEMLLGTSVGGSLTEQLPRTREMWVPEHYYAEVASGLRRAERRRAVAEPKATAAIARLTSSRLLRVSVRLLLHHAWARRGHMTIGDALYVVLAEELGATLVTADKRLAGAPQMRVRTITP